MNIAFATCNRRVAEKFIQEVNPSVVINFDNCKKLLDLIERDVLRVCDPMMHGKAGLVIGGKNYSKSFDKSIAEAQREFEAELLK